MSDSPANAKDSATPLLRVENLTIRPRMRKLWRQYGTGKRNVLDDVSFRIEAGSITGMIGDAGSGKMAMSLSLLRLEQPTSGEMYHNGSEHNLFTLRNKRFREFRRRFQLLLPDELNPLNPFQTIETQLRQLLRLQLRKLPKTEHEKRIEMALAAVELPTAILTRRPGQMISAHRQRAAIARALCVNPDLLICHDLTSGVDTTVQAELLNLLKDLRDSHKLSLFFITHDLAAADHMSDHLYVLNRGRIVESGTPESILQQPQHDYTRRLVTSTSSLQ